MRLVARSNLVVMVDLNIHLVQPVLMLARTRRQVGVRVSCRPVGQHAELRRSVSILRCQDASRSWLVIFCRNAFCVADAFLAGWCIA